MLNNILTALSVVTPIGLLMGILLALFISLFGLEEDENKKKIRAKLPGINCGACGFNGCNDYAEALSKGEAKPNLCIPGAEDVANQLGELLGIEVEPPKDVVAFVHCNGTCDACGEKVVYDGIATCKARAAFYNGPKTCSYSCLGCGDCAEVCISNAICVKDGIARVDTGRCVGCGLCAKTCPKGIIGMLPQESAVAVFCNNKDKGADARRACKNACIACRKCEKTCPNQAISVVNNCAVVDYAKCTGCGTCADACPTGCLKKTYFPDLPADFSLS